MNTVASPGQLRERPSQCEVGDWITARSRPEWDQFVNTVTYTSASSAVTAAKFRLEPYVQGKRVSVWVRIA